MSTITDFNDGLNEVQVEKTLLVKSEVVLDFSITAGISGDVVSAVKVPANSLVIKAGTNVLTTETGTHTLGDAVDPDGWDTSINSANAGLTVGDGANATGKLYSSADTIDLTLGADMDSGKVVVFAIYAQLENS